jgi:hypothetical protein
LGATDITINNIWHIVAAGAIGPAPGPGTWTDNDIAVTFPGGAIFDGTQVVTAGGSGAFTTTPEPTSLSLGLLGMAMIGLMAQRRRIRA